MANTTWTIDAAHSSATFSVRHLMITTVRGEFGKVGGTIAYDPENPEAATAEATIEVGSISTRDAGRDTHLKSGDFFDAEKYPNITFKSKSVKKTSKGIDLTGDLTIRDATREVVLAVEGPTDEQKDPWGNQRIGASGRTKIKRSDFGMTWNAALELGGVAVSDEVTIDIDVSLVKQK